MVIWNFRKYQAITVRKRKPMLEEILDETGIGFEGQRRDLGELQQVGVERRRIADDFHTHRWNTYTDHQTLDLQSESSNRERLLQWPPLQLWKWERARNPRSLKSDFDLRKKKANGIGERENGGQNRKKRKKSGKMRKKIVLQIYANFREKQLRK